MKMKRLFAMIVMLFAVVTLTACGGLDAIELMERSAEAQEEVNIDSMRVEIDGHMNMTMMGMSMDGPLTMVFEIENEDRIRSYMSVSMMGEEIIETAYIRDGYEYIESNEAGNIQRTRSEIGAASDDMMGFDEDLTSISEDWIEDSLAEATDEGYRLEFTINTEGMMEFLEGMDLGVVEIDDVSDIDDDDDESEEPEMTVVMYIDEDYLPTAAIVSIMGVEVSIEEDGMEIDMELELTITLTVEDVTIDFPDWLDEIGNVVPISEADLIGTWELTAGADMDVFMVFNADGTGIFVPTSDFADDIVDFTWELVNENHIHIEVRGQIERYEAVIEDGNLLTMSDLDLDWLDDLGFIRTADFELPVADDEDGADDGDEGEGEGSDNDTADLSIEDTLAGIWEYDGDEQVLYTIRPEGIGIRMGTGVGSMDIFDWYIVDGNLHLDLESVGMFGVDYEMWDMTLEGDTLTIESLQGGGTYRLIRADFLD